MFIVLQHSCNITVTFVVKKNSKAAGDAACVNSKTTQELIVRINTPVMLTSSVDIS